MQLQCFPVPGAEPPLIRPAERRRAWMDETRDKYAYRCLPLSMANAHGWEVLCSGGFEVEWNGSATLGGLTITPDEGAHPGVHSSFGSGILTFEVPGIFRTSPGFNLWVMGPPNTFKDGAQPLAALVESDWTPFTFTMNWKLTRPGHRVRFEKGEPYGFLFPVPRGLVEEAEPSFGSIESEPDLMRQYTVAWNKRQFSIALRKAGTEVRNERQVLWQGWYMRGEMPSGPSRWAAHQQRLNVGAFAKRSASECPSRDMVYEESPSSNPTEHLEPKGGEGSVRGCPLAL